MKVDIHSGGLESVYFLLHLQVMIQKQNRHMSMSLYLAVLAVDDTIVLASGRTLLLLSLFYWRFSKIFSVDLLNSVTNNECHKKGSNLPLSCKRPGCNHSAIKTQRQDLQIDPNACFSDLSDSLKSLNSMKVLFHLGKTALNLIESVEFAEYYFIVIFTCLKLRDSWGGGVFSIYKTWMHK